MEAYKLKTIDDLLASPEERVELINGEIVHRPMARAEHGVVKGNAREELGVSNRRGGAGGWWIITEVSVAYERHQWCPSHDLAGWRGERLPVRPRGVVDIPPDWVCEVVSAGHEREDTLTLFLLLQRRRVPFYWLIWPEDRTLIVHQLDGDNYRVAITFTLAAGEARRARIPPFDDAELDLGYILAE